MDFILKFTLVLAIVILISFDIFLVMMIRGAQREDLNSSWLLRQSSIFTMIQVLVLFLSNRIGLHYSDKVLQTNWDTIIGSTTAIVLSVIGLIMLFRAKDSTIIPEKLINNLTMKETIVYSLLLSIDALFIGLLLGFYNFTITIVQIIIITLLSILAAVMGTRIGYKHGMKYLYTSHICMGIFLIVLALYIFFA